MAPAIHIILLAAALCVANAYYERSLPEYAQCGPNTLPCESGLRCVGKAGDRLCLGPVGLGEACGAHPQDYCAPAHRCVSGKCVRLPVTVFVGLSKKCNGKRLKCKRNRNLRCLGGRCTKIVGLGKRCRSRFIKCKKGLRCLGRGRAVCKLVVGLNRRCGRLNVVCRGSLRCRRGRCRPRFIIVFPGRKCAGAFRRCSKNFTCVGTGAGKRCKRVLSLGGRCANKSLTVCGRGLRCCKKSQRCVIYVRPGGKCNSRFRRCTGSVCVGDSGKKRCKRVLGLGGRCANKLVTVCRRRLQCCPRSKRCVRYVRPGRNCAGRFRRCTSGFTCVRKGRNQRCKRVLGLGGKCANKSITVCNRKLRCCKKTQRCVIYVRPGGKCVRRFRRCTRGSRCIGNGRKKRCKRVLGLGGKCANSLVTVCARQLRCCPKSKRCVRYVRPGRQCAGPFRRCTRGFTCVGQGTSRRCKRVLRLGGNCSNKRFTICRRIHRCCKKSQRCVIDVRPGGKCGRFRRCTGGFSCIRGQCAKRVPAGGDCSKRYLICNGSLKCVKGRCVHPVRYAEPGQSCNGKSVLCTAGFLCRGPGIAKKCVKVVGAGEACDKSWIVCEDGLNCANGKCAKGY